MLTDEQVREIEKRWREAWKYYEDHSEQFLEESQQEAISADIPALIDDRRELAEAVRLANEVEAAWSENPNSTRTHYAIAAYREKMENPKTSTEGDPE